ncbi:hypothetical protein [Asanoa siamensis]|uniref:Uncharacterized protein n=1 Tax=Asanoa siamensis TaxID=926357 RepID=A0ABQ4CJS1_9ACTN|nr:hypothetical protein [Asanoa siamensis]GIF71530.1 hypothetical protein Asi02nite_10480 [Asanoa siamensis]
MRGEEGAMVDLLPKMPPEAPDGYVTFVDRHLAALRLESARLAGDAWRAEEIYPEVLADVAARWRRLELLARWFGRPAAAEDYLHEVLTNRARRWRAEQIYEVEMVVLRADPAGEAPTPALPPPAPFAGKPTASAGLARYRRTGPGRSSVGLRQARFLSPLRHPPAPIAEAAIAWWHAYVAQRRRKRVAAVIAVILALAALTNLRATNQI